MRHALHACARLHRPADHRLPPDSYFKQGDYAEAAGTSVCILRAYRHATALGAAGDSAVPGVGEYFCAAGGDRRRQCACQPACASSPTTSCPRRLRGADLLAPESWAAFGRWAWTITAKQIIPGADPDAGAVADCAGRNRHARPPSVAVCVPSLFRHGGALSRPCCAGHGALDARIHGRLCAAAAARAVDAAGDHRAVPAQWRDHRLSAWAAMPTRCNTGSTRRAGIDLYAYETVPRLYGQFLA